MTMRLITSAVLAACALSASACASASGVDGSYESEFAKLTSDCQARGGILATNGRQSGNAAEDYVCEIRSQSRSR